MTVHEASRYISEKLDTVYERGEVQAIGRMIVEYLNEGHNSSNTIDIHKNNRKQLELIVSELITFKPIQYVLNEAWFWNLKFLVNEKVLIPRPETEELVKYIIDQRRGKSHDISILDIGSGSGCIPVALKKELPESNITSVDVSVGALEVARINASDHNVEIEFLEMDFLQEHNWTQLGKFSVIVSNPPYIPILEKVKLDKNVTEWEPGTALFVPDDDPLLFYRKIALFGKKHLAETGNVFLECHQDFAQATMELFVSFGYSAELKKDIFDNDRIVRAWRKS